MTSKRGLGSIRKLPSVRYQVRHTDPNGVRRTARTTFKAKSQAEFELTKIRGAGESGTWHVDETQQAGSLDPKTITLSQLASHWRAQQVNVKGQPLSPNTLREYERLIDKTLVMKIQIEAWGDQKFTEKLALGTSSIKYEDNLGQLATSNIRIIQGKYSAFLETIGQ